MKKISALIAISRPVNILLTFLVIAVGYSISAGDNVSLFILLLAGISGSFTAAAGNIVNDIFDIESDKINHPDRPLAKETISYNSAKWMWFFFTLFSFIISSLINYYASFIVLGSHLLLILYSFRLKSTPVLGNFIIALLTSLAFIYGAFAAGDLSGIVIPAMFAFFINYIRELVKDLQDIKGDKAAGILTFPVKYGLRNTKKFILIFIIFLLLLTLYPFIYDYYRIEFFILMMIIVNPLMVYIIKMLWSDDENVFRKMSAILKFNMAVGLLAIYVGQ